ncbi:hypothetical protein HMPREF9708_01362 [Facklamia languida CCUG 37842]|uniref:Uncharacterized protein n=1 Tax=Facklamia languida CCUG 37842 TaxID=883113 RepID=H3NKH3_9LACT|nr:hypothetical protein HMPREF9708_01362 [Facklamia languida CCUG 37842]
MIKGNHPPTQACPNFCHSAPLKDGPQPLIDLPQATYALQNHQGPRPSDEKWAGSFEARLKDSKLSKYRSVTA